MTDKKLRAEARKVGASAPIAQRQDSLSDQLSDLHRLAVLFGLYDAADWVTRHMDREREVQRQLDAAALPTWRTWSD